MVYAVKDKIVDSFQILRLFLVLNCRFYLQESPNSQLHFI